MTKELMRCAVYGELLRDAATGKLMRSVPRVHGEDCEYCDEGKTPWKIELTVASASGCGCFGPDLTPSRQYIPGEDSLLGTFELTQGHLAAGECVDGAEEPCEWCLLRSGDFGQLKYWSGADCTGELVDTIDFIYAHYSVAFKFAADVVALDIIVDPLDSNYANPLAALFIVATLWITWGGATSYAVGSYLIHGDVLYQCHTAHTNKEPPNVNYWDVISSPYERECLPYALAIADLATVCREDGTTPMAGGVVTILGESQEEPGNYVRKRVPTGDVSVQWSRSAGANNFALVDDPIGSPDDDATYTYSSTGWDKDYFSFSTFGVPAGATITNIRIFARFRLSTAGGVDHFRTILKVNGVTYYGYHDDAWFGVYRDLLWTWTNNPNTGSAWTVDDVNGIGARPLQAFGYECLTLQTLLCTQIYVEVNYVIS